MVAACSRAETDVGPSMARNSHGENGTWPDLEAAETSTPKATRASGTPSSRARSA